MAKLYYDFVVKDTAQVKTRPIKLVDKLFKRKKIARMGQTGEVSFVCMGAVSPKREIVVVDFPDGEIVGFDSNELELVTKGPMHNRDRPVVDRRF